MSEDLAEPVYRRHREDLEKLIDLPEVHHMVRNDHAYMQVASEARNSMSPTEEAAFWAGVVHGLGTAGTIVEEEVEGEWGHSQNTTNSNLGIEYVSDWTYRWVGDG